MADLKSELKPGDEVIVYGSARNRAGERATVEKIGRTLIYLRRGSRTDAFRIDTQELNGPRFGYVTHFCTFAEDAAIKRKAAAHKALEEKGVAIQRGYDYTTEQLEQIAALIDTFKEKADG
jgi:hypothetical protein